VVTNVVPADMRVIRVVGLATPDTDEEVTVDDCRGSAVLLKLVITEDGAFAVRTVILAMGTLVPIGNPETDEEMLDD
jgi:hypothetical protein